MAIHINTKNQETLNKMENFESRVHLMPCTIKGNGSANVSKYFEPNIVAESNASMSVSFRGCPLKGQEQTIPKGYRGYVLQETKGLLNEEADRNVYQSAIFDKFIYWNYDKLPSENDQVPNAINWISIADAIHSPTEL